MKLFILRHAKTETHSETGADFDRKLKEKGKEQCRLMNAYLVEYYSGTQFDVYCSSARRTKSTLSAIKDNLLFENIS